MKTVDKEYLVYEDQHYSLYHANYLIPGYLILSPKNETCSFSKMENITLMRLGPMLALIYACLEKIINPDMIYCARFGEKLPLIHFHIFPRSADLIKEYKRENLCTESINGPKLMEWAINREKTLNSPEKLIDTIILLQNEFNSLRNGYLKD